MRYQKSPRIGNQEIDFLRKKNKVIHLIHHFLEEEVIKKKLSRLQN
jgi:hypothetical protein